MDVSVLRGILADLYPEPQQMRELARSAGIPAKHIRLNDTPHANATQLVSGAKASGYGGIPRLVRAASNDYPQHPWLRAYAWGNPPLNAPINIEDVWMAPKEVITTKTNVIQPFEWLADGIKVGATVVRIDLNGVAGSGIVVDGVWLITNNHVLPNEKAALDCRIEFGYEESKPSFRRQKTAPEEGFITSLEFDLTVCCIGSSVGPVPDFPLTRVRAPVMGGYCQIIGHPAGDYKKVSVYHNAITAVEAGRVQYLTSTLPGSSGSPVFDEDWNLIAIHHSGGWLKYGDTQYANQGTPAQRIIDLMTKMEIRGT